MKALSIRQPWAWCIIYAGKDIENRTWATQYRGPVLIHAAKTWNRQSEWDAEYIQETFGLDVISRPFDLGGIVGDSRR